MASTVALTRRISKLIEEYDAQGHHRTGTDVDRRSGEWLAEEVRGLGLEPELVPVHLDRVEPRACWMEVDGERIDGVPLFDCSYTGRDGIVGDLREAGHGGVIGLAASPPNGEPTALLEARRTGPERALVVVTEGRTPGLALLNAPHFTAPFGPPVMQVESEHGPRLREAARRGATVRAVIHAERVSSDTFNVLATLPGTDPARTLAVNTPRSGWWEVASERGGGIACWLEVMRAFIAHRPASTVIFAANTGHELGFYGLEVLLAARPTLATDATWLHFGANIGAAAATQGNIAASDVRLGEAFQRALQGAGTRETRLVVRDARESSGGGGEMAIVHRRGGRRYAALTNDNALFHMREDRYPSSVDVPQVAAFASGSIAFARMLADRPPSGD